MDQAGASAFPRSNGPNLFKLYEQNIGPLTPLIADALKDAEQSYPAEWVAEALEIAVKSNKRSWKYAEAILRRWKEEGHAKEQDRRDPQEASRAGCRPKSRRLPQALTPAGHPSAIRTAPTAPGWATCAARPSPAPPVSAGWSPAPAAGWTVSHRVRARLFSLSHLDELKDLTFESFKSAGRKGMGEQQVKSLEWAYNTARQYAGSLNGWLLLSGGFGCGKTHLAAAIANTAVAMGVPTLFLTVPDLLDSLRFCLRLPRTTSFEQRFDEIRVAPLLVLDDFGTQNATAWAQEKLFQIVNYRYINKLPLVVTTNLALDEIEPRIRSRLADPELVSAVRIAAPDYRRPTDDKGHHELSSLAPARRRVPLPRFSDRREDGLDADELASLEKALKAATDFAAKPSGWLVLTGPYGCGKTHLAAAIANALADQGEPPLFIMVPDLLDHLRATFSPQSSVSYDRRFDDIRTAPLLILDDLGHSRPLPGRARSCTSCSTTATTPNCRPSSPWRWTCSKRSTSACGSACWMSACAPSCAITAPAYHGGRKRKART